MAGITARLRILSLAVLVACLLPAGPVAAQDWARKMIPVTSHNFGTVAKGSKTEYRFVIRNIYQEDVHVVGVRTSCGCTSPTITKHDLKTHETAEVVATFNTRSFIGQHGATLTVTFDKPFSAEVQLRVAGNIRGDVTFDPPFVDLGNVDLGKGSERQIRITRMGSSPWEIKDVRSANPNFEVALSKATRTGSQTLYDLTAKLKPSTPAGYIKGQLILVTNDPRATQIPMDVEGRVVAEVTVSPQLLANMTEFGTSPLVSIPDLAGFGFGAVLYPVTLMRLAMKAMEAGLAMIADEGTQESILDLMQSREELYDMLGYDPADPDRHLAGPAAAREHLE